VARSESILLIALLIAGCSPAGEPKDQGSSCAAEWRAVTDGIDYRAMNCESDGDFDLHLVRVDPRKARIGAVMQRGGVQSVRGDAAVAINANFFDENFRPLGMVMSEGKSLNPLHPVEWQSIFYVKKSGEAGIVPSGEWESVKDAVAAFQAGPRLTVAGAPNKVSQATPVARSGVCVTDHVIFFATPPNRSFDVHQMIELAMKLECRDSLLLDGGPSTQLYVNVPGAPIAMQGDVNVPAYIVAK